jgi:hypothetical protein
MQSRFQKSSEIIKPCRCVSGRKLPAVRRTARRSASSRSVLLTDLDQIVHCLIREPAHLAMPYSSKAECGPIACPEMHPLPVR